MESSREENRREENRIEGDGYRFYCQSSARMPQCLDNSIALTITSPPYWNAIDYNIHAEKGSGVWHRTRQYDIFGDGIDEYLDNIQKTFAEVLRATVEGGFCAVVAGTLIFKKRRHPIPMLMVPRMLETGWEFHEDIVWNKVTGGVKRAGSFIQRPKSGYYYPNIMTEYILIFRKPGPPRRGKKQALEIDDLFKREIANNVWHIPPVPPKAIDHPCPFPLELARRLVLLYSEEGDEALDPFLGSGQTALAALREGRRCVGYDIEARYLRLSQERIRAQPPYRRYHLIPRYEKIPAGGE